MPLKPITNNEKYWTERFILLENQIHANSMGSVNTVNNALSGVEKILNDDILKWYGKFASNNGVSITEAKRILNANQLSEFRWTVDDYIKHGRELSVDPSWLKQMKNASAKVHITRLEMLQLQARNAVEQLAGRELSIATKALSNSYLESYYRTAFELEKGVGVGFDIAKIDSDKLKQVLAKPWTADNRTFSDRIWQNKADLNNELQAMFTRDIFFGKPPQGMIDDLAKKFNTTRSNAERLILTESAYFRSTAQREQYARWGIQKYKLVAVVDARTSELCLDINGMIVPFADYEVGITAPPFHPRCRTTYIPYFGADWRLPLGSDPTDPDEKYGAWKARRVNSAGVANDTLISPASAGTAEISQAKLLTNVAESGIIDVTTGKGVGILELAKKRDEKIYITDIAVSKVDFVKIPGIPDKLSLELQTHHKELLTIAQKENNSDEVLRIWNINTNKYVDTFGNKNEVKANINIDAQILSAMSNPKSLAYLHNHPSKSTFSYTDIKTFLADSKISLMTVVTNQGKVYYLYKSDIFSVAIAALLFNETVEKLGGIGEEADEKFAIEFAKVSKKGGVIYGE